MRDPATQRHYPEIVRMWKAGRNTADIAEALFIPEHFVDRCVWRYREVARKVRVDQQIQAGAYDA